MCFLLLSLSCARSNLLFPSILHQQQNPSLSPCFSFAHSCHMLLPLPRFIAAPPHPVIASPLASRLASLHTRSHALVTRRSALLPPSLSVPMHLFVHPIAPVAVLRIHFRSSRPRAFSPPQFHSFPLFSATRCLPASLCEVRSSPPASESGAAELPCPARSLRSDLPLHALRASAPHRTALPPAVFVGRAALPFTFSALMHASSPRAARAVSISKHTNHDQ